jgi:hypothetical protein
MFSANERRSFQIHRVKNVLMFSANERRSFQIHRVKSILIFSARHQKAMSMFCHSMAKEVCLEDLRYLFTIYPEVRTPIATPAYLSGMIARQVVQLSKRHILMVYLTIQDNLIWRKAASMFCHGKIQGVCL